MFLRKERRKGFTPLEIRRQRHSTVACGNLSLTGFTLLEIIIVIIIIGILASIALPNYNRSVERSRLSEAISTLRVLRDAQMRYAAEKGVYAGAIGDLDINISSTGKFFGFGPINYDPPGENGIVASAVRNAISVGGGYNNNYMVMVYENGTFQCSGITGTCPSEFLP